MQDTALEIDESYASQPLATILRHHPRVNLVEEDPSERGIRFRQGTWKRRVLVGDTKCELKGLVELIDNNPLVCADEFSVPDPATSLALIALGPLGLGGVITAPPALVGTLPADESVLAAYLAEIGVREFVYHHEPIEIGRVAAVSVLLEVDSSLSATDLESMFAERYERSFYVSRAEGVWDPALVAGTARGVYRIELNPTDSATRLVKVVAMADLDGKLGPKQAIHAMNVMAGFEETLGVS